MTPPADVPEHVRTTDRAPVRRASTGVGRSPTGDIDLAVVGAGPAGCAAAITAARAGLRVVVVDKAMFPRDKCCGDGLTTGALRHLHRLGLDPARVPSWQPVRTAAIRSAVPRQAYFPLPQGGTFAVSARRVDLDAALVELARAAGAEVREGWAARGVTTAGPGGVTLAGEGGAELRARYVVAADGAWSPVRKSLGAGSASYRGDWHALRQYFRDVAQPADQLWVWFEPDLLPGYAWSFPLPGGRANVGFGIHRRPGEPVGPLGPRWEDLVARPHIEAVLGPHAAADGPPKTWPIPARVTRTEQVRAGGRVLFVGDAARASDPMTGEGIAQALETGALAARAIIGAGAERPEEAAAVYRRAVRRSLAVDDAVSRVLTEVLRRPTDRWLTVATVSGWMRRGFARWMFEDIPRGLFLTPRRWHRGALRSSPPFPLPAGFPPR